MCLVFPSEKSSKIVNKYFTKSSDTLKKHLFIKQLPLISSRFDALVTNFCELEAVRIKISNSEDISSKLLIH